MVASSRLEKSEQLVNVATHSPTATPEAARYRKEGRAESMTCTIILIQKSIPRVQLTGGASPVYLVSFVQPNKPDRPNQQEKPAASRR